MRVVVASEICASGGDGCTMLEVLLNRTPKLGDGPLGHMSWRMGGGKKVGIVWKPAWGQSEKFFLDSMSATLFFTPTACSTYV